MFACIHAPEADTLARNFSPWVEMADNRTAVFTLTPRQLAECLLTKPALMAIAATAEAAMLAGRNLPGFLYIEPGQELEILGPLPIDVLPPDPELFETFYLWGIRTLADLAKLPESGIAERMGVRGLHLQRLAKGLLDRPLRPLIDSIPYDASAEMDHPIELREPLLFLIGRFLYDLTARMKSQSVAAQALCLRLNQQERRLGLPFPTRDLKLLIKLVEHSLERQPPAEPVEKVYLELIPVEPRRVQHGLFTLAAPEPEKLELTLGKIRGLVGEQNVLIPQLFDTHRPGAGEPAYFLPQMAFRYFRPQLDARVETDRGMPREIRSRIVRGRVVQAAGPWRSSGDWWRGSSNENASWDRDEWDVLCDDHALYRLVLERGEKQWFVEGVYD